MYKTTHDIDYILQNDPFLRKYFAITELKMAVAKLIYNFEVVAHQPENVTRICAMIQKPLDLYLKFIPREGEI